MDIEQFHSERVNLQGRVTELIEVEAVSRDRSGVSQKLIAEIGLALEELRVAEEDLRDFTQDLLASREECEAERKRYAELFDFCPDCYIVTSLAGVITEVNLAGAKMLGVQRELLRGKPLLPFIARDDRRRAEDRLPTIASGERVEGWEVLLQDRSGGIFIGSINAEPISDTQGSCAGIRWMIRDVTRQKEAAAVVDTMRERLRRTEQLGMIGTLAAGLGHDVKNLLFPIRSRLDSLAASDLPERAGEDIEAVRQSVRYLQQLAVNLQMLAEEPGSAAQTRATTHLPSWWEHTRPLLIAAVPRRVSISIRFEPDLPSLAVTPHLLTQAAFNLVNNAGKAIGAEGHITIWAECVEGESRVRFGVSDNGRGLAPDELERLRNRHGALRTHGLSTGVGLPLVRSIVESCGGSMEMHSEVGRGTTVALRLPAVPDDEAESESSDAQPFAAISIGDPHLASSMRTLLQLWRLPARSMEEPADRGGRCVLWVAEPTVMSPRQALEFLSREGERRLVLVGSPRGSKAWEAVPALWIEQPATPRVLRDALSEVVHDVLRTT